IFTPCLAHPLLFILFSFNATATTEIYTLSLHDALPISRRSAAHAAALRVSEDRGRVQQQVQLLHHPVHARPPRQPSHRRGAATADRKSTRLNSSHRTISYAVFCLKKKKKKKKKYT